MGNWFDCNTCSGSIPYTIDLSGTVLDGVYYLVLNSGEEGCFDCTSTINIGSYTATTITGPYVDCPNCEMEYPSPTPTPTSTPTPTITETPTNTPTTTPTPTPTPTIPDLCVESDFCLYGTGTILDDSYVLAGIYDGHSYFSGSTNSYYIYFNLTNQQWCLSSSLGGSCLMFGKSPCYSNCPDLCSDYFVSGVCPTPTPTPTPACDINFEAIFDCEYIPTPTPTPTSTITPTPSVTPTQTNICFLTIDFEVTSYSPTPTPTPTITPSNSPEVTRPCNFSGDVSYNIVDGIIECPFSSVFQNCNTGTLYYTINNIIVPNSNVTLEKFMVFEALVNGNSECIFYMGVDSTTIGSDVIVLQFGPYGYSNLGDCSLCEPSPKPSPSPSNTLTPTPTPTLTPTVTIPSGTYFVYSKCDDNAVIPTFLVQTLPALTIIPGEIIKDIITGICWKFEYSTTNPQINPSYNIINYLGNYLSNVYNYIFPTCEDCFYNCTQWYWDVITPNALFLTNPTLTWIDCSGNTQIVTPGFSKGLICVKNGTTPYFSNVVGATLYNTYNPCN